MRKTWVGYPVQSNLWRLPEAEVMGIVQDTLLGSRGFTRSASGLGLGSGPSAQP